MTTEDKRFIYLEVPENQDLVAAVGKISIIHGHIDRLLRVLFKFFSDVTVEKALAATAYEASSSLRDRIRKLAKAKLGESTELVKLQALLQRCKISTEKRNALIHNVFARELDGEPLLGTSDGLWVKVPTLDELNALSSELQELIKDMTHARVGYLEDAVAKRAKK